MRVPGNMGAGEVLGGFEYLIPEKGWEEGEEKRKNGEGGRGGRRGGKEEEKGAEEEEGSK